jgi:hypothetical protein
MQRFLSAVVLMSVAGLWPARAAAQASGAPTASTLPPTSSAPAVSPPAATPKAPAPKAPAPKPPVAKPNGAKAPGTEPTPKPKLDDHLSDEAELSRVVGLYEAGKYRECGTEIERLLDPTGRAPLRQPAIVENARVYWAACLLGAGEGDAADAPLRAAIHENPQMKPPDSLVFPQPVVEHFLKVRDSLVNEIRAAEQTRIRQAQAEAWQRQQRLAEDRDRMHALEQLARKETIVTRNSRAFAFVPFGVGQFQNRETGLGYTLLVSEALLGSLSITAIIMQSRLASEAYRLRASGLTVKPDYEQLQRNWSTTKTLSFWAFATVAAGGILQAQLEFVPEFRETRARPLPPSLAPSPKLKSKPTEVSALPYFDSTGGGVTLTGSF